MSFPTKEITEVLGTGVLFSGLNADMVDGTHLTSLFRGISLKKQDLDADNLSTPWTCYYPETDMNSWSQYQFLNFPTSRPEGGFCLINIKEGNYKKQIYMCYNSYNMYVRRNQYMGGSTRWAPWTRMLTLDDLSSIQSRLTALENK